MKIYICKECGRISTKKRRMLWKSYGRNKSKYS